MRKHLAVLGLTLAITTIIYGRVSSAFFCGYDDFIEIQRARFADSVEPVKIFTTTHFNSFKYRPLNRASSLITYLVHPNDALPFRVRNLFFHEAATVAIYCLGLLLFDSWLVAAVSALLFCVHPLVNQVVDAAVFGMSQADALFLWTLVLFFLSLKRSSVLLLSLAMFCGAVSTFIYESSIVVAPLMAAWWVLDYLFTRRLPSRRLVMVFIVLGCVLFGSYLAARQHFGTAGRTPVYGPIVIVKGAVEYGVALLTPIDLLLAHDWFQMPLPSEMVMDDLRTPALIAGLAAAALIVFVLFQRRRIAGMLARAGWRELLFLLLGIALSLAPFLVFSDHVSETYIYLAVAFFSLILGRLISFIPSRGLMVGVVAVLMFFYGSGTWNRNQRVYECGATARRLISNLPLADWKQGEINVSVAKSPDTVTPPRYGLYNYSGLDTIAAGEPHINEYGLHALEDAAQLFTGNPAVRIEIYNSDELPQRCREHPGGQCYWIHPDATITKLAP